MSANNNPINRALHEANNHDIEARKYRLLAGELLIQERAKQPNGSAWFRQYGLDERTAELLIAMATRGI